MRWWGVLALATVAGCVAPAVGQPPSTPLAFAHSYVTLTIETLPGVDATVKLHHWAPSLPSDTAALMIHGIHGSKDEWAALSVPGYSLGEHLAAAGFHAFAMDLPGQNDTRTLPNETFEHAVDVIAAVGGGVRTGAYADGTSVGPSFRRVVGVFHSLGTIHGVAVQARHGPFDAVVYASFSVDGVGSSRVRCARTLPPICDAEVETWYEPNMDAAVIDELVHDVWPRGGGTPEGVYGPAIGYPGVPAWTTPAATPSRMRQDAAVIDVPVLILAGTEDALFEKGAFDDEAAAYASAKSVEVALYPETGHIVFHHLDREQVFGKVSTWMASTA